MMNLRAAVFVYAALCSTDVLADPVVYRIEVDGLACPFCVYGVEKRLQGMEGVSGVETDLDTGVITVAVDEGATLDQEAVRGAVSDAGFTLRSFSLPEDAPAAE